MSQLKKGGRHTEATKGLADHDDEPSNCIICLERVSCRGKLSVCNHWFCFPCILEWAENTNTCPICKARFRCITKVHVSPFKSPPTKVRVGDKDQRVWNDDDDIVADDVLDAIDSDDLDDDYQPSVHVDNPWSRSLQNRRRQQGHNVQRGLSQTSRQLQLDQYDLEDSFIDDTDEALQAYLYSAYSRDDDYFDDVDNVVVKEDNESGTGETDDEILPRGVSPYVLRNSRLTRSRSSGIAANSIDRALQDIDASPASTDSFIVSDGESADELNSDWVPFGNHSKNSRNNNRNQVKTRKQDCKRTTRAERSGPSSIRSRRSQRLKKQQDTELRPNISRQKREQTSISDDEFQQPTSSRVTELDDQSAGGWINMAQKRAKANDSTASSHSRTRQRTSTSMQRTNITRKGKKPLKHKERVDYDSSSDSEVEVLKDCSNHQEKPHRTTCRVSNTRNKSAKRFSPKLKQNQECLSPVLTSAHLENYSDASGESAPDDNYSDTMIIQPTPCSKTTRSIFTKRRHRSPVATFDNHHPRSRGDTSLSLKSSLQIQFSPVVKMRSQKRKRVIMSASSDSD